MLAVDVDVLALEGDALALGDVGDGGPEGLHQLRGHLDLRVEGVTLQGDLFQVDFDLVFAHEFLLSCEGLRENVHHRRDLPSVGGYYHQTKMRTSALQPQQRPLRTQ